MSAAAAAAAAAASTAPTGAPTHSSSSSSSPGAPSSSPSGASPPAASDLFVLEAAAGLTFSSSARHVIVYGGDIQVLDVLESPDALSLSQRAEPLVNEAMAEFTALSVMPGSSSTTLRLVVGHTDCAVEILSTPVDAKAAGAGTGSAMPQLVTRFDCEVAAVDCVRVRQAGVLVAVASEKGMVQLFLVSDGTGRAEKLVQWQAHECVLHAMVWHPSARLLATMGTDGKVRVWDTHALSVLDPASEDLASTLEAPKQTFEAPCNRMPQSRRHGRFMDLAWGSGEDGTEGEFLAFPGDSSGSVSVLKVTLSPASALAPPKLVHAKTLPHGSKVGHTQAVNSLVFMPSRATPHSPQKVVLATAASDGQVLVWNLSSPSPSILSRRVMPASDNAGAATKQVFGMAWHPHAPTTHGLVAVESDGFVRVWREAVHGQDLALPKKKQAAVAAGGVRPSPMDIDADIGDASDDDGSNGKGLSRLSKLAAKFVDNVAQGVDVADVSDSDMEMEPTRNDAEDDDDDDDDSLLAELGGGGGGGIDLDDGELSLADPALHAAPVSSSSSRGLAAGIALPRPQVPFQPGSTSFEESSATQSSAYLAWNQVGTVIATRSSTSGVQSSSILDDKQQIVVEFASQNTASGHRIKRYNDQWDSHAAALTQHGLTLGSRGTERLRLASSVRYHSFDTWARNDTWTLELPAGEDVELLAATERFVVVGTSTRFVRVISVAGVQQDVLSVSGPLLCLAAQGSRVAIVYHSGMPLLEQQSLTLMLLDLDNKTKLYHGELPMSPSSHLMWMGFSTNRAGTMPAESTNTLFTFDSMGVLRALVPHFGLSWVPLLSHNYLDNGTTLFPLFVFENRPNPAVLARRTNSSKGAPTMQMELICVEVVGTGQPSTTKPPVQDRVTLRIPLAGLESNHDEAHVARLQMEEEAARLRIHHAVMAAAAAEGARDPNRKAAKAHQATKQHATILQRHVNKLMLLQLDMAVKEGRSGRAVDLFRSLSSVKLMEKAIRLARHRNKTSLADRLNAMYEEELDKARAQRDAARAAQQVTPGSAASQAPRRVRGSTKRKAASDSDDDEPQHEEGPTAQRYSDGDGDGDAPMKPTARKVLQLAQPKAKKAKLGGGDDSDEERANPNGLAAKLRRERAGKKKNRFANSTPHRAPPKRRSSVFGQN